ncbi:DUF423 domain-containing protein [Flavobacterium aquatile]|uniref:Membrane protein n=1 Tax=Flavobacterium aquatile LMG 4008 = ATCC 11947 TaxID=1453498 RepID=A0A095SRP4_9FLAO|nr:DUF423 domain-containing protein [Flavobacterium aquatile]KGD67257.1 membrane protein [Flavobacterium aquatile LMG 4008 = ATCC 11947]OXA66592.1 DUF423 domain-containing protein [Flavobacterium aquatile LMG 4008 = ATCC 11947]GEC78572.1 membrane protein [Flavobacterium aquatile]
MDKKIFSTAAFFGMTAIILGAFGAHALKKVLTLDQLATFETGVKYQMYHALFLLFLGLNNHLTSKTKKTILIFTILGIIFFSGSIYLLATNALTAFDFKVIGFITPIGGLLLIVAWSILMIQFLKKKA